MRLLVADLERRESVAASDPLVVDASGVHSVADVLARGRALAAELAGTCGRELTLLVQADNTWRTAVVAVAAGYLDGVLAVIGRHSTPVEFAAAREDIDPDAVLVSSEQVSRWMPDTATTPLATLEGWAGACREVREGRGRWDGGAVIGLTSGSTGRPKGVVQSEEALRYAGTATIAAVGLGPGDRVAGLVPLSSTAALCFGLHLPLLLGGTAVLADRWDPAAAVRLLAEHDIAWTMCVPTMALQMAAATDEAGVVPRSLRAMTVGGGPMDAGALERAEHRLDTRILRVFGMSECLGHTTPSPADPPDIRLGCDGRPFPGTEVRAVDADGAPVPAGTAGRAQVRGPSLFRGYAREGRVVPPDLTPDGFLPTGDLAAVHPDGTVSIRGREKDVIIRGGRNIDITEVEFAVASHPAVEQLCVVPLPDEVLGERIAALVVTLDPELDLDTVTGHLAARGLSRTKWPEFLFRVDALPQNGVGKLSRPEAARLAARLHDDDQRAVHPPST